MLFNYKMTNLYESHPVLALSQGFFGDVRGISETFFNIFYCYATQYFNYFKKQKSLKISFDLSEMILELLKTRYFRDRNCIY